MYGPMLRFSALLAAGLVTTCHIPLYAQAPPAAEPLLAPVEFRSWRLADGNVQQLALVRCELEQVYLRDRAGALRQYSLEAFSATDRQWIKQYLDTLWARIVLDPEVLDPITLEWIELFGSSSADQSEGPFGPGVSPIQMGGDPKFTPENLRRKYGIPEVRTMTDVEGPERNVTYYVYGPIAVGAAPDRADDVWVRVDRTLASQGLQSQAQLVLSQND